MREHIDAVLEDYEFGHIPVPDPEDEDAFDSVVLNVSARVLRRMQSREDLGDYVRARQDPSDACPANFEDYKNNHIAPLVHLRLLGIVRTLQEAVDAVLTMPQEEQIPDARRAHLRLERLDQPLDDGDNYDEYAPPRSPVLQPRSAERRRVAGRLAFVASGVIAAAIALGILIAQTSGEPSPKAQPVDPVPAKKLKP